jgi:hypothetical protein
MELLAARLLTKKNVVMVTSLLNAADVASTAVILYFFDIKNIMS